MARRQAAGRFRLLRDLGLPRRGRHPGVVRHLRPRPRALADLAQELGLNTWAVEDAVAEAGTHQGRRVPDAHLLHGLRGGRRAARRRLRVVLDVHRISGFVLPRGLITVRLSPHLDIDAVSQRFDELGGQEYGVGALVHGLLDVIVDEPLRGGAGARRRYRGPRGRPVREQRIRGGLAAQDFPAAQGPRRAAPGGAADARGRQLHSAPQAATPRPRRSSTRCTPTSTTTCCGCRSGRSRCGTWSPRCSRPTCRYRTRG